MTHTFTTVTDYTVDACGSTVADDVIVDVGVVTNRRIAVEMHYNSGNGIMTTEFTSTPMSWVTWYENRGGIAPPFFLH